MDSLTKGTAVSRETLAVGTALQGINRLPDEILIEIFSYLGLCDLAWCSHTCRRWRAVLREKKSLWRGRECSTFDADNIREVLAVAGAMPRFETLSLRYSIMFGVKIAWPVADIFDNYKSTLPTWEPYFRCFDTECLVIQYSAGNNLFFHLLWVDRLTLRKIVIRQDSLFPIKTHMCKYSPPDPVRVASNACNPVQWMRDARHDLFSGRGRHGGGTAEVATADSGTDGAVCPALEEVEVVSRYIWCEQLEELCGLGPVRTLRVRCQQGHSLTFVWRCRTTLEELELWGCQYLREGALADLFCLERLRVLCLSHSHDDFWKYDTDLSREGFCHCCGTTEVVAVDPGTDGVVCPALEEVRVSSYYVWSDQLEEVCSLGPVRVLRVRYQQDLGLTFVRRCCTTLEELELWDCRHLPENAFADLLCLERLRVLRLSDCHIEAQSVGRYVAGLPCLKTCLVNGSEVLPQFSS